MPTDFQPTGAEVTVGGKVQPAMAPIYVCEGCGYRGAAFGLKRGEQTMSYCGWDQQPVCVGKGRKGAGQA